MKHIAIIPTYNEKENIERLVTEILALPIAVSVLVVDDNSPDGTGGIVERMASQNERVSVIHRPEKLGLGTAYIAGFKKGMAMGTDWLLTMDADFSHNPRYIPHLFARGEQADLVIGSRYVPEGGVRLWGRRRRVLSWGANTFARLMLGLQAHDCTAGFRCYRREMLESIDLDAIFSNGYSFLIEMIFQVQRRGWRISEVPIIFEDRRHGVSKISQDEILKALSTVLRLSSQRWLRTNS